MHDSRPICACATSLCRRQMRFCRLALKAAKPVCACRLARAGSPALVCSCGCRELPVAAHVGHCPPVCCAASGAQCGIRAACGRVPWYGRACEWCVAGDCARTCVLVLCLSACLPPVDRPPCMSVLSMKTHRLFCVFAVASHATGRDEHVHVHAHARVEAAMGAAAAWPCVLSPAGVRMLPV